MGFISIKFGGTSMGSAENILECADIIKQKLKKDSIVVTVSAVAGVTNELFALIDLAKKQKPRLVSSRFTTLKNQHKNILKTITSRHLAEEAHDSSDQIWNQDFLPLFNKLETILLGTSLIGDITEKIAANICSFGEKLSSHLMAQALNCLSIANICIDSERAIKTDSNYLEANVNFKATARACHKTIKPLLTKKIVPILTGFIGKDTHGDTTLLGRGGSDYTASILGICLGADAIEIWTDVDGIMSSDPKMVENAISWQKLDMETISEMAYSGAKVVHPKSITAAIRKNIPVYILNTFNRNFAGTKVISGKTPGIKGIICSNNHVLLNLENPNMLEAIGFLARISNLSLQHKIPIDVCATSETTFTFSIKSKDYSDKFYRELCRLANVKILKNAIKLSVIGSDITKTRGLLPAIFDTLEKNNIEFHTVSIGYSENNITILISDHDDSQIKKILKKLHEKLINPL